MSGAETEVHVDVHDLEAGAAAVLVPRVACLNYGSCDAVKVQLKHACADRVAHGAKTVVIDLEHVGLVDSCGLSVLISVKKAAEAAGARFALCGLSPVIERLFEITKLDRAFAIFPDRASAAGHAAA